MHWIVAGSAPWIATQYAPNGQKEPFYWPMFQQCLPGIFRTSGREAARSRCIWCYKPLIEYDRLHQKPYHCTGEHFLWASHNRSLMRWRRLFTFPSTSWVVRKRLSSHINAMAIPPPSFAVFASSSSVLLLRKASRT